MLQRRSGTRPPPNFPKPTEGEPTFRRLRLHGACSWAIHSLREPLHGVHRLGMHAFHAVLARKPARYSSVLKLLQSYLAQPINRRYARRFKGLTREGLAELAPI